MSDPRVHQVNGWWYIEGHEWLEFHSREAAEQASAKLRKHEEKAK